MSEQNEVVKPKRATKSIDQEIEAAKDKLKRLQAQKSDQERKQRDRTQKAVIELIRAERLDTVTIEAWREALPKVKAALKVSAATEAPPRVSAVQGG